MGASNTSSLADRLTFRYIKDSDYRDRKNVIGGYVDFDKYGFIYTKPLV